MPACFSLQPTPVLKEGSEMQNAIHIHLVLRASKASHHIDDTTLGEGMVMRLPRP